MAVRCLVGVGDQTAPVSPTALPGRLDQKKRGPCALNLRPPAFLGDRGQVSLVAEAGVGELVQDRGCLHG